MQLFLKCLRIVDACLGVFLIFGILLLFLFISNDWSRYWPLDESWNWYLLLGAFGSYAITRFLSWTFAIALKANAQLSPDGRINKIISVFVLVGVIAIGAVVFNFIMALSRVGN